MSSYSKRAKAAAEFNADKIKALAGGMITGVFTDYDPLSEEDEVFWGFEVTMPDGSRHDVWVNRDGEGNGPGAVSVEPSPTK